MFDYCCGGERERHRADGEDLMRNYDQNKIYSQRGEHKNQEQNS